MPNRLTEIIRDSKALFGPKDDKASTTSVNGILGDQIDQGAECEAQVPENKEDSKGSKWKEWIHLVLNKSGDLNKALFACKFARLNVKCSFFSCL